ncbi:N-acetyl sugar amidotransferase [Oceanimonas marisflavi]|uniref:N-acetyl sugar amidotransferase n=1 Tax=Oceanimonas marisflavi TaxID=2059724 RepID=UPI000D2FAF6E|nr:N-acetyl sugar amidotransferase [Oceanimonas marisflavi]
MIYCKKCVMPSTRPGISFDSSGVCSACRTYEGRVNVDYKKRWDELHSLCDKYRGMNGPGGYDCMIAVSGGKDSHYQVHVMKELMGMNPLLVSVEDNFPMTEAGKHNIKNISEEFGCDIISMKPNIKAQKKVMRYTFEKYAKPTYFVDRYIYTYPLHMAVKFNTPLLVYGENVSFEYGGEYAEETYSAKNQIKNGVASGISKEELIAAGVTPSELNFFDSPSEVELEKIDPIYLGYFVEWNSVRNYNFAKSRGFHDLTHEWTRTNHVESYDQVDSRAYLVHPWLKYPKFGHAFATDYASRLVRYGEITRDEAILLVKRHDHAIDPLAVRDFCEFLGYRESEFYSIVDGFYNLDYFKRDDNGCWSLISSIA